MRRRPIGKRRGDGFLPVSRRLNPTGSGSSYTSSNDEGDGDRVHLISPGASCETDSDSIGSQDGGGDGSGEARPPSFLRVYRVAMVRKGDGLPLTLCDLFVSPNPHSSLSSVYSLVARRSINQLQKNATVNKVCVCVCVCVCVYVYVV